MRSLCFFFPKYIDCSLNTILLLYPLLMNLKTKQPNLVGTESYNLYATYPLPSSTCNQYSTNNSWDNLFFVMMAGAWLQALPVSSLGFRLDDNSLRIAVDLRLGLPICSPHVCQQCGAPVDQHGLHGLSCKKGGGKHHQHAELNDAIHRALAAAGIPSTLEPSGLVRSDGKRPDGITYAPWAQGRPLVWDVTVPDTLAASYRSIATRHSGAVAEIAEKKKESKYSHLTHSYIFSPLAIESLGAMGPKSLALIRDLGTVFRTISATSGHPSFSVKGCQCWFREEMHSWSQILYLSSLTVLLLNVVSLFIS